MNEDLVRQAGLDHQFWKEQFTTLNVHLDAVAGARNTLRIVLYLSHQYIESLKAGDLKSAKLIDGMIAEFGEDLEVEISPLLHLVKQYRKR